MGGTVLAKPTLRCSEKASLSVIFAADCSYSYEEQLLLGLYILSIRQFEQYSALSLLQYNLKISRRAVVLFARAGSPPA